MERRWRDYAIDFERRIEDLHGRIHRGAYRAKPSKRSYVPKPEGGMRPLGIAALEDKIVQQAARTVLECIYEQDFLGFSYGYRLDVALTKPWMRCLWVLAGAR
jgi:RNA-directed DNA polymerase